MNKALGATIISAGLIISAALINIEGIKHSFSPDPSQNILNVEGGAVRLGKVNSEREFIEVTIYMGKESEIRFDLSPEVATQFGLKNETPVIHLTGISPESAEQEFKQQLKGFIQEVNSSKAEKDKIKGLDITSTVGFAVKIESRIVYGSELQGAFPLTVDSRTFTIEPNQSLFKPVDAALAEVITNIKQSHKQETFM